MAVIYTCPMHREVNAGKCPRCGMALLPEGTRFCSASPHDGAAPFGHHGHGDDHFDGWRCDADALNDHRRNVGSRQYSLKANPPWWFVVSGGDLVRVRVAALTEVKVPERNIDHRSYQESVRETPRSHILGE